jgi:cytochrome c oxidase subunit II
MRPFPRRIPSQILRPLPPASVPALLVAPALLLQGCGGWQSVLEPHSPGARQVESLWWFAFGSTTLLATLVILGLLYALRRAGRATQSREGGETARREERFILLAGAAFPTLFLIGFLAVSVRTGTAVSQPPEEPALTIEVVGHMFWWEIRYPEQEITTANEIRIPAGRPVRVEVTSADVIHSFWVPQLSPGKIDMIPGRTNVTWMQADEPGLYRGQCTEFCGVQHALMSLLVIALSEAEFSTWAAGQARNGVDPEVADEVATRPPPDDPVALEGLNVFVREGCGACHAIAGVSRPRAAGSPGPDLTNLAQRRTLGALTVANDREHLAAWIRNPHQFKPGVRMPSHRMDDGDLHALVTYLETLR